MEITASLSVKVSFIKDGASYLYRIGKKNPGGCALEFTMDKKEALQFGDGVTALVVRDHLQEEGYADSLGETLNLKVVSEEIDIALNR